MYITLQDAPRTAQDDFHALSTMQGHETLPAPVLVVPVVDLAAAVDAVLQSDDALFEREYKRQYKRWCMQHGEPAWVFNRPNLTAETYAAIEAATRAVLNQVR